MTENYSIQRDVADWKGGFLPSARTAREEFLRMSQEFTELDKATLEYDGTPKSHEDVRGELADMQIGLAGIAIVLGIDLERAAKEKMMLTRIKYPSGTISGLLAMGVDFDVAMAETKRKEENKTPWERRWQKHTK